MLWKSWALQVRKKTTFSLFYQEFFGWGMLILLKTAYDESVREMSPGFLLQAEMFKALFTERNTKRIEFYGRVREGWTKKWTNETRGMFHLNVYRYSSMSWARRLLKSTSVPRKGHDGQESSDQTDKD